MAEYSLLAQSDDRLSAAVPDDGQRAALSASHEDLRLREPFVFSSFFFALFFIFFVAGMRRSLSHREEARLEQIEAKDKYDACKNFAFMFIGILTFVYTLAELGTGVYFHILVLLSDGFHNLSDVVALGIGLWASKKSRQSKSNTYSYGFARTELLGALVNGCFLLSLALYVLLEAIPKFIKPEYPEDGISFYFIIGAAVGLGLNVCGALVFFITGRGHSHAGHSHEHGGHSEVKQPADTHAKKDKKKQKKSKKKLSASKGVVPKGKSPRTGRLEEADDHRQMVEVVSGGGRGAGGEWAEVEPLLVTDDEEPAGHDHSHDHASHHGEDDGHSHASDEHGHQHHDKGDEHGHQHHDKGDEHGHQHHDKADEHGHRHHEDKPDAGHSHAHGGHNDHADHSHGGGSHANESHADHNLYAIFLHFLGDALSSVFVLATALLWYFFPCPAPDPLHPNVGLCHNHWVVYVDPATSVIVVGIILYTTIPMVRSVLSILLQKVPKGVNVPRISRELNKLPGVASVHDLHIWELVSGLNLASVHLDCRGDGEDFNDILVQVRRVFHANKIHSVTVQPEFVGDDHPGRDHCEAMCVSECVETWCCEPEIEPELARVILDPGL